MTKKVTPITTISEHLAGEVREAFRASAYHKHYGEDAKAGREAISQSIERGLIEFEGEAKSIKTEWGLITKSERKNSEVDKQTLIDLVEAGVITYETLINMASFNGEDLKKVGCEEAVNDKAPTVSLSLKPNDLIKKEVLEEIKKAA